MQGLALGSHGISVDGRINWIAIGEISVVMEGNKLVAVKHRRSGYQEEVDKDLMIDDSFELKDNHCLVKASFCKGLRKYKALDMFKPKSQPHLMKPWHTGNADLKEMVARHAQDFGNKKKAAPSQQSEAEKKAAFEAPIKEKQRLATKRAREALEKAKVDRENKKRLSIGQATST